MLVRSKIFSQFVKIFSQFVEKIKKLTLGLSKQHNNMLKIRPEMLKIRKNGVIIKLRKNYPENFPISENLDNFLDPRIPGKFLKIFRFPEVEKGETLFTFLSSQTK